MSSPLDQHSVFLFLGPRAAATRRRTLIEQTHQLRFPLAAPLAVPRGHVDAPPRLLPALHVYDCPLWCGLEKEECREKGIVRGGRRKRRTINTFAGTRAAHHLRFSYPSLPKEPRNQFPPSLPPSLPATDLSALEDGLELDVRIDQGADNGDVQPHEVVPRENVVVHEDHADVGG